MNTIYGKDKVLDTFFEMIRSCKNEVRFTMLYMGSKWGTDPSSEQQYLKSFESSILEAKNKGATIKIIGPNDLRLSKEIKRLESWGASIALMEHGDLRFLVTDHTECLIVYSEQFTESMMFYTAVKSDSKGLVALFDRYFEHIWAKGTKP